MRDAQFTDECIDNSRVPHSRCVPELLSAYSVSRPPQVHPIDQGRISFKLAKSVSSLDLRSGRFERFNREVIDGLREFCL